MTDNEVHENLEYSQLKIEETRLLNNLNKASDKETALILVLELANLYFQYGEYLKALKCFIQSYRTMKLDEVLDFLLVNYYEPNVNEFHEIYKKNSKLLRGYQYFYGEVPEIEDIQAKLLWEDDYLIIYYYKQEFYEFEKNPLNNNGDIEKYSILIANEYNIQYILDYEKCNNKNIEVLTRQDPFYLYYDIENFQLLIQLYDLQRILELKRIVIIVGIDHLKLFFNDLEAINPQLIFGNGSDICMEVIKEYLAKNNSLIQNTYIPSIDQYYEENKDSIIANIKGGKPKILFVTSRFTTILQYHTKDMQIAAQELGMETMLVIGKSDIHWNSINILLLQKIYEFKPDIVFTIDYFRFQFLDIPNDLFWVTWIQDPMSQVMDLNTPGKLLKNDFVLNHFTTWSEFAKLNYPKEKLFNGPIPANDKKYKIYQLTEEEKEKYCSDICFVCHAGDYRNEVEKLIKKIAHDGLKNTIKKVCDYYYTMAYEKGIFFHSKDQFEILIDEFLEYDSFEITEESKNQLVDQIYLWINQKMFRVILARWLIEAGYNNIKLWGNGWMKEPEFKKYAMGPAENGEVLSKIYQASKIVIGNNIMCTSTARAWESMLSGAFYLSNYVPPEEDITDIRKIIEEGQDFVMFHDKEDFLKKVDFYLNHEKERKDMAEIGRQKALERMTFTNLMKSLISEIQKSIGD